MFSKGIMMMKVLGMLEEAALNAGFTIPGIDNEIELLNFQVAC